MKKQKSTSVALRIVKKQYPNVVRVVDAKHPIIVTVTESDSKNSKLKDHDHCAMAVACKRQEHADAVIVSVRTAYVVKGDTATRFRIPEMVSREIVSFDRNGGFAAGAYRLIPHGRFDLIGRYKSGPKSKPTDKKMFRHVTTNVRTSLLSV